MKTSKEMTNLQIAELLRAVAASYKLKNEQKNRFKIVAYERAADAVEHASSELKDLWDDNKLDEVPGIGKSIAEHLGEIFRTGKSKHFDEIMEGLPPAMFELMGVPGIGPKTAYRLAHELSIKSLNDLENAAKKGHIAKLEGFGEQSEQDILKSLEEVRGRGEKRQLIPYADEIASSIIEWLNESKDVVRADPLGSLRRRAPTIGDIDISAASKSPGAVIEHFTKYPKTQRVLERGERSAAIIVPGNIQVDLMVETPDAYGALLQHFTGSKHHNIKLRELALKRGLSLSDYGIYILKKGLKAKPRDPGKMQKRKPDEYKELKKFSSEEEFYKFLKMDWIPPELREDSGEIQAALVHNLPKLVDIKDVKSDLQIHSDFDIETSHDIGESSMEEIIEKANELGYQYLAFTEHNPSQSKHNERQIIELLKRKKDKIDKINYSLQIQKENSVKKVYNSLEIDIKTEGGLPVPEKGIALLDFALVSIHSSFKQSREIMTKRVLSALEYPKAKIFAHPTARRLNEREGIDLDWDKVFEFCLTNDKWIEINADPMRLDLPDILVHEAVKRGVKLSLGTDAHHKDLMDNMRWGISVARRGWAQKGDIVNTSTQEVFEKLIS